MEDDGGLVVTRTLERFVSISHPHPESFVRRNKLQLRTVRQLNFPKQSPKMQ